MAAPWRNVSNNLWHYLAIVISSGFLGACISPNRVLTDYPLSKTTPPYAESGSVSYTVKPLTYIGTCGRTGQYEQYIPDTPKTSISVLLTHGFMRDLSSMRGWAEHWASYGIPVTVVSTCNSTWYRGRHRENADDIRKLAHETTDGGIIYAGFSSGGLAALLAAAGDPRTEAYLGLDAVDTSRLGKKAAGTVSFPALFIFGEPSACNSKNNMMSALSNAENGGGIRIRGATHCHFENPYSSYCEKLCGSVEPVDVSERITEHIHSLATAWILLYTGVDSASKQVIDKVEIDGEVSEVLKWNI